MASVEDKAFRTAADTLWAIAEEKKPDVTPEVAFEQLEKAMEELDEGELKVLLTVVAVQLYFNAEAARLTKCIQEDQATLASIRNTMSDNSKLKELAGSLHRALSDTH